MPATFFEIGDQIGTYGQGGAIERRMLADGDMIGDHTFNHANVSPTLISTASTIGFETIQWDIDPRDWSRPGADAIYNNVVANAHPGAIVIQHEGGGDRSETVAALPARSRPCAGAATSSSRSRSCWG